MFIFLHLIKGIHTVSFKAEEHFTTKSEICAFDPDSSLCSSYPNKDIVYSDFSSILCIYQNEVDQQWCQNLSQSTALDVKSINDPWGDPFTYEEVYISCSQDIKFRLPSVDSPRMITVHVSQPDMIIIITEISSMTFVNDYDKSSIIVDEYWTFLSFDSNFLRFSVRDKLSLSVSWKEGHPWDIGQLIFLLNQTNTIIHVGNWPMNSEISIILSKYDVSEARVTVVATENFQKVINEESSDAILTRQEPNKYSCFCSNDNECSLCESTIDYHEISDVINRYLISNSIIDSEPAEVNVRIFTNAQASISTFSDNHLFVIGSNYTFTLTDVSKIEVSRFTILLDEKLEFGSSNILIEPKTSEIEIVVYEDQGLDISLQIQNQVKLNPESNNAFSRINVKGNGVLILNGYPIEKINAESTISVILGIIRVCGSGTENPDVCPSDSPLFDDIQLFETISDFSGSIEAQTKIFVFMDSFTEEVEVDISKLSGQAIRVISNVNNNKFKILSTSELTSTDTIINLKGTTGSTNLFVSDINNVIVGFNEKLTIKQEGTLQNTIESINLESESNKLLITVSSTVNLEKQTFNLNIQSTATSTIYTEGSNCTDEEINTFFNNPESTIIVTNGIIRVCGSGTENSDVCPSDYSLFGIIPILKTISDFSGSIEARTNIFVFIESFTEIVEVDISKLSGQDIRVISDVNNNAKLLEIVGKDYFKILSTSVLTSADTIMNLKGTTGSANFFMSDVKNVIVGFNEKLTIKQEGTLQNTLPPINLESKSDNLLLIIESTVNLEKQKFNLNTQTTATLTVYTEDSTRTVEEINAFFNNPEIEISVSEGTPIDEDESNEELVQIDKFFYFFEEEETLTVQISDYDKTSTTLIIPESIEYNDKSYTITSIGDAAFYQTLITGEINIPQTIEEIGVGAFYETSITGLILHEGLKTIGEFAFSYCELLIGAINIPKSVVEIGKSAFSSTSLTELTLQEGLRTIGESAFSFCNSLGGTLKIPKTVETITNSAFRSVSITKLTLQEGLRTIGPLAFSQCPFLEEVVAIPQSVETIEDEAFYYCKHMKGITFIGKNLQYVGNYSFAFCSGLAGTIYLSMPTIYSYAFYGCSNLAALNIDSTLINIGKKSFGFCEGLRGSLHFEWFNNMIIESGAFYGCFGFNKLLRIPSTTLFIGSYAFSNCNFEQLEFVVDPTYETNMIIEEGVFSRCPRLVDIIDMPPNIVSLSPLLFSYCAKLSPTVLIIPEKCKTIGERAFFGCEMMHGSLNLSNVETIGNEAFHGCKFSNSLMLPSTVKIIGEKAFSGCNFIGSITIPENVIHIGKNAFYNCQGFTDTILIEADLEVIEPYTFAGCGNMTGHLIFSRSTKLTKIKDYAFANNIKLTGILNLPESINEIGEFAFFKCQSFYGKLYLPKELTRIGKRAFSGCIGLSDELEISETVTYIGEEAFFQCTNLSEIHFKKQSNDVIIENQAFGSLEVICLENLPKYCSADEDENSICYSSNGFGEIGFFFKGKINLYEDCTKYKIVNTIVDILVSGALTSLVLVIGEILYNIIKNWNISTDRLKAILTEIIEDNLEDWKKDKNNEEIIIKIGNEIHDRMEKESELLKTQFTEERAKSLFLSILKEKWPTIPNDFQETLVKMSFNDIIFKSENEYSNFCNNCCCSSLCNSNNDENIELNDEYEYVVK